MMRAPIESILDGRCESIAYLDRDGAVNEPLEICFAVTVRGHD